MRPRVYLETLFAATIPFVTVRGNVRSSAFQRSTKMRINSDGGDAECFIQSPIHYPARTLRYEATQRWAQWDFVTSPHVRTRRCNSASERP